MKYKLIKENDKFRLLNSKQFIYYNALPNPDGTMPENRTIKTSRGVISTKILTDGEIKSVTDLDSKKFVLPKHLGKVEADLEEAKDLELINHNYVIRVLTQLEYREFNKGAGLFQVIKDVEVYLKDKKNKEALRNIKKTLNLIYGQKGNYSSIFETLFSRRVDNQDVSYEKTDFNVYKLVK